MSWQPTVEKDFYLARDLCALTGLGKASVYEAIEKGQLPGYKAGSRYVIPGPAFRDFAEGKWVPLHMRIQEDHRIEGVDERSERSSQGFLVNLEERRQAG